MAHLDGLVRWLRRCNTSNYQQHLLPFLGSQRTLGYIKPSFAEQLSRYPKVFTVNHDSVSMHSTLKTSDERTSAAAEVLEDLREAGLVTGWRSEQYAITDSFYDNPYMLIERAAAVPFGIKSYGVHMNGYVIADDGTLKLWVGRRASSKPTWPGKLDHVWSISPELSQDFEKNIKLSCIVHAAMRRRTAKPHGISPTANMIKEAAEEASIPDELARSLRPAGAVSYAQMQEKGLKRDCLFVFDLRLPSDFQPIPADGEVESFELMDIHKVKNLICDTEEFKDNCNLVIIDFMLRMGVFPPESPGYLDLAAGLRQQDCS